MQEPVQIRSGRRISGSFILLLTVAGICLLAAATEKSSVPFAFFAGCLTAAFYIFSIQPPPITATLNDGGIQTGESLHPIPYSEIEGLSIKGEPRLSNSSVDPNRIEINHGKGTVVIGKRSSPKSPEIYAILAGKITPDSRPDLLPSALAEFYREQSGKFGAERVWAFGGRRFTPILFQRARALHFGASLLIISLVSLLAGALLGAKIDSVIPVSIGTGICGGLALFTGWITLGQAKSGSGSYGLVLAPQGIALAQGNVKGQSTWENLHGATYVERGHRAGIKLQIPGTNLVIADRFSSPLQEIHPLIKSYLGQ